MNEHLEYLELISAAVDGALSPEEQARLDAHLAVCPECRALMEDLTAIHDDFTALPPAEVPAELYDRIMARVRADNVVPFALKKTSRRWRTWAASAAVLALVMVGAWQLDLFHLGSDRSLALPAAMAPADAAAPAAAAAPAEPAAPNINTETTVSMAAPESAPEPLPQLPAGGAVSGDALPQKPTVKTASAENRDAGSLPADSGDPAGYASDSPSPDIVDLCTDAPSASVSLSGASFARRDKLIAAEEPAEAADASAPAPAEAPAPTLTSSQALDKVIERVEQSLERGSSGRRTEADDGTLNYVNYRKNYTSTKEFTEETVYTVNYEGLSDDGTEHLFAVEIPLQLLPGPYSHYAVNLYNGEVTQTWTRDDAMKNSVLPQ